MRLITLALVLLAGLAPAFAQKPVDYFKKGITPPYPLTGTLKVTTSQDDHFSSTVNGTTYTFHCSSTENAVDCTDGPGVYRELLLADGSSIYIGGSDIDDPWLLADIKGSFDDPLSFSNSSKEAFHLRWKSLDQNRTGIVCVQAPGTESIPDGKERKKYSKTHHMEYCYFAIRQSEPRNQRL